MSVDAAVWPILPRDLDLRLDTVGVPLGGRSVQLAQIEGLGSADHEATPARDELEQRRFVVARERIVVRSRTIRDRGVEPNVSANDPRCARSTGCP